MLKKALAVALGTTLLSGTLATQALANEISYRQHIQPLWQMQCAACHGEHAPSLGKFKENSKHYEGQDIGPRMLGYAELSSFVIWPETGALMRRLDDGTNTANGQPGNMYQYLGETEAERQANLQVFIQWVGGQEAWFLNRWNARGDVPGVSKEQLDRLKLAY